MYNKKTDTTYPIGANNTFVITQGDLKADTRITFDSAVTFNGVLTSGTYYPLYITSVPAGASAYYTGKPGAYGGYLKAAINTASEQTNYSTVRDADENTDYSGKQPPYAYVYFDGTYHLIDGAKHSIAGETRTYEQNRLTIDDAEPAGKYIMSGSTGTHVITLIIDVQEQPQI